MATRYLLLVACCLLPACAQSTKTTSLDHAKLTEPITYTSHHTSGVITIGCQVTTESYDGWGRPCGQIVDDHGQRGRRAAGPEWCMIRTWAGSTMLNEQPARLLPTSVTDCRRLVIDGQPITAIDVAAMPIGWTPQPELPACAQADVTCDGNTNAGDLATVRSVVNWNHCPPAASRADINRDGCADGGDLLIIRASRNWNKATGPCRCP